MLVKPIRYIATQFFILKQVQVNPRNAKRELIILAGLTFVWALSIWADNRQEFSLAETRLYALHCFVVLSIECLIYAVFFLLAKKRVLHRIIPLLIITAFCVTNFYLLIPLHSERIAIMRTAPTLLLLMALFAVSLIVLKKFRDTDQSPLLMGVSILVLLLAIGGNFFWNQHKKHEQLIEAAKLPDHFTFPTFKERPNVYFFFHDALIPEAMSRKFLNIDKLQYISVIRNEGLRLLKNVFADRVPTNPSINSFIAMDLSYFDNMPRRIRHLLDTGAVAGPLYELFRRNEYKIQLISRSSYHGAESESDIDSYAVWNELGLCKTVDNDYALLGYCIPAIRKLRQRLFGKSKLPFMEYYYKRIYETSKSPDRWLTLSYVQWPGHTLGSFYIDNPGDLESYSSDFKSRRDPGVAIGLQRLIMFTRMTDPNSIMVILGDHGAYVSRGMQDMAPEKRPLPPKEYFQDRHAVVAAIYPKDFCVDEFEKVSSIARIGRTIVKCLSGGKDPLPAEYQLNDDHLLEYFYE
ncbi:MAG: hypothetical protein V3V95_07035 [Thermodesulfobacteriota bacterium]